MSLFFLFFFQNLKDHRLNCRPDISPQKTTDFVHKYSKPLSKVIGPLKCPLCDKIVSKHTHLKNHLKVHDPITHNDHKCSKCGAVFVSSQRSSAFQKIRAHYRNNPNCDQPKTPKWEELPKPLECRAQDCKERFTSTRPRDYHETRCTKMVHKCDLCGFILANKQSLSRHRNNYCIKRKLSLELSDKYQGQASTCQEEEFNLVTSGVETTTFIDQVKSNTVKMSARVLLLDENGSFSVKRDSENCSNKVCLLWGNCDNRCKN